MIKVICIGSMVNNLSFVASALQEHSSAISAAYFRDGDIDVANHISWLNETLPARYSDCGDLALDFSGCMVNISYSPVGESSWVRSLSLALLPNLSCLPAWIYCISTKYRRNMLCKLKEADVIIACGIEAAILSSLSGKPYIIYPHGYDARLANGDLSPLMALGLLRKTIVWLSTSTAFSRARIIGSHDSGLMEFGRVENKYPVTFLPLPFPKVELDKNKCQAAWSEWLGINFEDFLVAFFPASIEFEVKGFDVLLEGLNQIKNPRRYLFIFVSWGDDIDKFFAGLNDDLRYAVLPERISRPLILSCMAASDVVGDQFKSGSYGSILTEAASLGKPVITNRIDSLADGSDGPPIYPVKNSSDIAEAFDELDVESIMEASDSMRMWFSETHESSTAVKRWEREIKNLVEN